MEHDPKKNNLWDQYHFIGAPHSDSKTVMWDFDPKMDYDVNRAMIGVFPLTPEFEALLPTRVRIDKYATCRKRKFLPHIFFNGCMPAMSQQARAVVEELEPKVHRFQTVEVFDKQNTDPFATYHILLAPPTCDALILEKSDLGKGIGQSSKHFGLETHLVLDASKALQHHIWRLPKPLNLKWFYSGKLLRRFREQALDGWVIDHKADLCEA